MARNANRREFLALAASGVAASVAGCSGGSGTRTISFGPRVDDWQYDPDDEDDDATRVVQTGSDGGGGSGVSGESASYDASAGGDDAEIGFAVGGAQDVNDFRNNVSGGYVPQPESMAYEGLFYDYYFDTGDSGGCLNLFCPTYSPAVSPDPLSGETEQFLTVGLDSRLTQDTFDRKPLNLVVVLDISGSMDSSFAEYYYDRHGNRREPEGETDRRKMAVARDALVTLTRQLRPVDRLGVVLFDNESYLAKPLRFVGETDMDAIREHIQEDVRADGGTNIEAGIATATEMLSEYDDVDPTRRENRTVLLTDAMPNIGDTSAGGLRGTLEDNADRDLFTTFVGIGLDFNAELVDRITEIRGANYYSVHSADEFDRRMGEQFEYMVTPLVFDLSLELSADDYEIRRVYGTTAADEATGEIMHVRTLFPSPQEDGATRGGVVLVQLEGSGGADQLALSASWETRDGRTHEATETVRFPGGGERSHSTGVRKAVLLARHANLLRNWALHERDRTAVEPDDAEDSIAVSPEGDVLSRWEQQSVPLAVSDPYDERIAEFRDHFESAAAALGDENLEQELDLLDEILAAA